MPWSSAAAFSGLEAAAGLQAQGMDVTVVHLMPTLMERQLDPAAGHLLQRAIEARGIKVLTRANTKAIVGKGRVEGVELDNGTRLPADLVVMAVGIRPNMQLAKEAGITVNRGIVVDATMRTSDPDIFALGECAEADGQVFGLVAPLYEMANTRGRAARRRCRSELQVERARRPSSRSPASTSTPPATSPRPRTARRSCCATPRAASIAAWC